MKHLQQPRLRLPPSLLALLLVAPGLATAQAIPPANPDGVAQAVVRQAGLEGRVLWMDGTANLQRLSSREGVAAVFDRCVKANINTVVVDVKPLSGHVLYDSKVAPRLREWRGVNYPAAYDLLRTAIHEGRRRGLRIHANINVFSDGHKLMRSGPGYDKPDQQAVIYDVERTLTTPRGDRKTLAVGANRTPGADEIILHDAPNGGPRSVGVGEAFAMVLGDRVEAVVDGALAPAKGVNVPPDGYLLIGRGEGAKWLLQSVQGGDVPVWSAANRLIPVIEAPSETVAAFLNPANPAVRDYQLKIVDELVTGYDLDGIVFDRMRYPSIQGDFSELSRQKFEEFLGQKLNRYPADIYSFDPLPGRPLVWGPYFKQWLEWRAKNIRTWLEEAVKIVRSKRPVMKVGAYVGSWYSTYYTVGANWGSEDYQPGYDWMSPTYGSTGYAGLLDWITTGCYHPIATREQARLAGLDENYTIQAAAERSTKATGDATFVYAGLYVQDFRGTPEGFREAIRTARAYSHGVMLFDLSQIEDYGYWNLIQEELPDARTAPHEVTNLLDGVRALRQALGRASR